MFRYFTIAETNHRGLVVDRYIKSCKSLRGAKLAATRGRQLGYSTLEIRSHGYLVATRIGQKPWHDVDMWRQHHA